MATKLIAMLCAMGLLATATTACGSTSGPPDGSVSAKETLTDAPPLGAGLGEYEETAGSAVSWASWLADDIDGMVSDSDIIAIGIVTSVSRVEPQLVPVQELPFTPEVGKNPNRPTEPLLLGVFTTFNFIVEHPLKGAVDGEVIQVRQGSGVYDKTLYILGEDVPLVPGDRYLLFLSRSMADPEAYETTAFIGGQFAIRNGIVKAAYSQSNLAKLVGGRSEQNALITLEAAVAKGQ